jgi:hypothetical protein
VWHLQRWWFSSHDDVKRRRSESTPNGLTLTAVWGSEHLDLPAGRTLRQSMPHDHETRPGET